MAAAAPVHLWSLQKGTGIKTVNYRTLQGISYPPRTAGAFRLVDVQKLLNPSSPEIKIWEFTDIKFGNTPTPKTLLDSLKTDPRDYRYVAVSHVWDYADEVDNELKTMTIAQKLNIDVTAPDGKSLDTKTISWLGLQQLAHAADRATLGKVKYIWLDFLCLDQVDRPSDKEKEYQLCIMGSIYEKAHAVITMIGGIPAVQGVTKPTAWMDRAWTLQESILNDNTWIYVKWKTSQLSITDPASTKVPPKKWRFHRVYWPSSPPGQDLCLVKLVDLLDLTDAQPLTSPPGLPTVAVLDGMTPNAGDVPRRALRVCLSKNKKVKYTGVWRSMFMRTSSKPVDVVYSIMHIFKIHIDPYRKNRDPIFVFNDLARKAAARDWVGPVWLIIGGVPGGGIPVNADSQLLPKFPHLEAANIKSDNAPPKMGFGGRWDWVGFHLDDSPFYIAKYDIRFLTHSHPHIVNALMLRCKSISWTMKRSIRRGGTKSQQRTLADINLGGMDGRCLYFGKIPNPSSNPHLYGLYVGEVADMRDKGKLKPADIVQFEKAVPRMFHYTGRKYIVFVNWNKTQKAWERVADGIFKPNIAWRPPTRHYILTIGNQAQKRWRRWPVPTSLKTSINPDNLDQRKKRFHNSYGFEEMPDLRVRDPAENKIHWGHYRGDKPSGTRKPLWSKRYINYNIRSIYKDEDDVRHALKRPTLVSVMSARSSSPPASTTESTDIEITNDAHAVVPYSYDGWSRSEAQHHALQGVEGLIIPKTTRHKGKIPYQARIWFGRWVMYLQIKYHQRAKKEFWHMVCVPYRRRGIGGFLANEDSLTSDDDTDYDDDTAPDSYPYRYNDTTSPVAYPVYQPQPVVPILLPVVIPLYLPIFYPIGFFC